MTSLGFSSFFPFLPLYVADLGATSQLSVEFLAGLAFSGQAFTMMIASPVWGMIADRYGRKLMVERAMFGGAVVVCLMGFARSAEELVLLRAFQGLITGVIGAHNALVASVVPRERTGYAMGLLQVGLGIGVALGPLIGGLVADLFGYRAAFFVTASLLFISGIIVWVGVEENFRPVSREKVQTRTLIQKWNGILSAPGVLVAYSLRFVSQFGRMARVQVIEPIHCTSTAHSAEINDSYRYSLEDIKPTDPQESNLISWWGGWLFWTGGW